MTVPAVTAAYAGAFGLLLVVLSAWVVAGRASFGIHHGDGGEDRLNRRIRAHANFTEYVPLILFIVALLEGTGSGRITIHLLLGPLLVARLSHPVGMIAPLGSLQQGVFRGGAMVVTWSVLAVASAMLLLRAM